MTDTYGIDYVAIISIVVTGGIALAAFLIQYYRHKRSERSEQIGLSREIWDRIETQYNTIKGWALAREEDRQSRDGRINLKRSLVTLKNELKLFVKLVEIGEIKEGFLREYYQGGLSNVHFFVKSISRSYADIRAYPETKEILELIKKYHELIGKTKEYDALDSSI
jgi:hypothetical protein